MNTRSLIALAIVALGLVAYLAFFGVGDHSSKEQAVLDQQLFSFNADLIHRMEITGTDETLLLVRNEQLKWELEKPVQYPADRSRIGRVLSELEFAKRIATLEVDQFDNPDEMIKQFGLAQPQFELRFRDDEHAYRLSIGNETARKGNFYAQLGSASQSELVVVGQEIKDLIDTEIDSWRSKRIFDFDTTSVTSVLLEDGGANVELQREADNWTIIRPYSGGTEPASVVSYLGGMLAARVNSFASTEDTQLAEQGLSAPEVTLEIGFGELRETLSIGNPVNEDGTQYYAQVSSKSAVFLVQGKFVTQMKDLLNRVREKHILSQSFNELSGLQIQKGGLGWSIVAKGGEWKFASDGKVVNVEAVNTFFTTLSKVKGIDFFEKSEQNRSEFLLTSPQLRVTLRPEGESAAASPDSLAKRINISTEQEGIRYVESDYLEYIVMISADALPVFPDDRVVWLQKDLGLPDSDQWESISWNAADTTIAIERGADGQWPSQWRERPLDHDFLNRQIELLESLEVLERVKLESASFGDHSLILSIVAGDSTYKLEFGLPEHRLSLFSVNQDREGYVISERDYQLLAVFPLEYSATENE
ncbi:MAG: DUF4340 domain-containing protein [Verrucomicrobiota bacterium]